MVPTGSRRICGHGLRVTCPERYAVSSPPQRATKACPASWQVSDSRNAAYQTGKERASAHPRVCTSDPSGPRLAPYHAPGPGAAGLPYIEGCDPPSLPDRTPPLDRERGRRDDRATLRLRLAERRSDYLEGALENPELGSEELAILLRSRAATARIVTRVGRNRSWMRPRGDQAGVAREPPSPARARAAVPSASLLARPRGARGQPARRTGPAARRGEAAQDAPPGALGGRAGGAGPPREPGIDRDA